MYATWALTKDTESGKMIGESRNRRGYQQLVTSSPNDNVTCSPNDNVTCSSNDNVTCSPSDNVTCSPNDNVTCSPNDNVTCSPSDNVTCFPSSFSLSTSSAHRPRSPASKVPLQPPLWPSALSAEVPLLQRHCVECGWMVICSMEGGMRGECTATICYTTHTLF